ncbi:hypothetical protein BOG92_019985 [Streptomyces sp. WAC00263]|nr:hypothetical protein BOG92_019985 [Streptomyces sp. WAC00263]
MTAGVSTKITARLPETGWAQARRQAGQGVRTCVPARTDRAARQDRVGPEWNIVRGED